MDIVKLASIVAAFCLGFSLAAGNYSDCTGEHEYFDAVDGTCKKCEKCTAGQQPREYCGYGSRSTHYGCENCPPNTFSSGENYLRCIACAPCNLLNSAVSRECTPTSNRICGICHPGFYRPLKSDGTRDNECHECSDATSDLPECQVDTSSAWIIGVAIGAALLLFIAFCFIFALCCQARLKGALRRQKSSIPEKNCKCKAGTRYDGNLTDSRSGGVFSDSSQADLQMVDEVRVENKEDGKMYRQRLVEGGNPLLKSEVNINRFDSAFQSGGTSLNSDYPNLPTAEYQDSPSIVGDPGLTYSNTPTKSFETYERGTTADQGTRSLPNNHTNLACGHGSCSSRMQRKKAKTGQSSSCESLLSSSQGDRDSFGERRNSRQFVDILNLPVESFDFSEQADQKNP